MTPVVRLPSAVLLLCAAACGGAPARRAALPPVPASVTAEEWAPGSLPPHAGECPLRVRGGEGGAVYLLRRSDSRREDVSAGNGATSTRWTVVGDYAPVPPPGGDGAAAAGIRVDCGTLRVLAAVPHHP